MTVDVALRDGATVSVRPLVAADEPELRSLLDGLSIESRTLRFFSAGADVHRAATYMASLTPERGRALVAVTGEPERIVAHAAYVREEDASRAEVAFEVADDWQGRGISTLLLAHLSELAIADGIETFTAVVLPDNRRMIQVFRDSGFAVDVKSAPGELLVELPAELGDEAHARFEERDQVAAAAAVAHVLRPESLAVIGVSTRDGSVGAAVLHNLQAAGYRGRLFVVHPREPAVGGLPAHRSVAELPEPVELAVIALPAESVVEVARECGAAGVRALVVLSAGFAEIGPLGRDRQAELLAVCRASGMRLIGPNCLGVLNTAVGLNASFAPVAPPAGTVAFASQSGAFGIAAIAEAARRGLGLSAFVSTGNKADLSGNDLLRYFEDDEGTDVIGLYLESFGNPRRFGQIARRVAARKPVIAVKSGRSAAGSRAAVSHTGALLAASDSTVDALFRHAGVIRTGTVGELFDVAALLAGQPLPAGDRVGILTNAGGPGIACADAAAATISEVLAEGGGWLVPDRVAELLAAYGVPQVAATVAATPAAVARCAAGVDGEVAIKAIAPGLIHKSDVGAVRLGVRGSAAAGRAAREIAVSVREAGHTPVGYLVQEMAPEGVEMLVGLTSDPDWGPVVACAAGGRAVELLGDVQSRLAPLSRRDAGEMVRALRTFPLLDGYRGAPRANVAALEDVLVRIAALAAAHPEIAELDCNPVLVGPAGATVVDARVRIASPRPPRPYPSLDR